MISRLLIMMSICILLTAGCTPRGVRDKIDRAESLMVENPDSSRTLLEEIDTNLLHRDSDRARYALLMADMHYMCDINDTDYHYIASPLRYYPSKGDASKSARAYFLAGQIDLNRHEYDNAIIKFLHSERFANKANDQRALGLAYRSLGDSFYKILDYGSEVTYYKLAYDTFRGSNDSTYKIWSEIDLSRALSAARKYNESLNYSLKIISDPNSNFKQKSNARLEAAFALYYQDKYAEACAQYDTVIQSGYNINRSNDFYHYGSALLHVGRIDEAKRFQAILDSLDPNTTALKYEIAKFERNYHEALTSLENEVELQSDEIVKSWTRNYSKSIHEFMETESKLHDAEIKNTRTRWIMTGTILMLIIIIGFIIYHYKRRIFLDTIDANMLRIRALMDALGLQNIRMNELNFLSDTYRIEITELKSTADDREREIDRLRSAATERDSEIARLRTLCTHTQNTEEHNSATQDDASVAAIEIIREAIALNSQTINELFYAYYQNKGSKQEKIRIHGEMMKIIEKMNTNGEIINKLEDTVNRTLDNLMQKFRKDFTSGLDFEYSLFLFSVVNFSPSTIAVLQDISIELVYTRKASLKRKLRRLPPEVAERYLPYLKNTKKI